VAYHPFRDLGLKVLAIALAALLWLTVAGEHVAERSMRVPLEFRNIPKELEIVGNPPTSVDVRIRGSSALLHRLEPGEVVVVLDLANARTGARLFHLRSEEVHTPYGIEVAQIVPGTLALDLEKSGRRRVPVMPAIDGDPAPGFVVGRVSSDPATVEIVGPESRIKQLVEATTEPVSVAGSRTRVTDQVTVGVADSAVRLVTPQSAIVVVEVLPAPVEQQVTGVPVRWRNLAPGLRADVRPKLASVTVRGQEEAVAGLRAPSVELFVDLEGLGPAHYNLRVQVVPTQDFGVTEIKPAVVDVVIK
jgi:YbbR domain-containing protein